METVGNYRLRYKIAQGGMAEIFAAESLSEKAPTGPLCVKRIRPEFTDDAEFERMFIQEARIAMALRHPNVVRVFEFDKHDGRLFLAMEYIDGWDLKRVLAAARNVGVTVPLGFAFYVTKKLLSALQAARAVKVDGEIQTVVHRDISPHNILVAKDGGIKLTDFGIAKAKGCSRVTHTGIIKGKLAYLSPEQAMSLDVGPSADLYCAGLVLYEMLVGERFNQGQNDAELLARVMEPNPPRIPWLSDHVNRFLQTMLSKEVEQRFETPTHALAALDAMELPPYTQRDAARFGFGLITSAAENSTGVFRGASVEPVESSGLNDLDAVPTRTSKQFPLQKKSPKNGLVVLGIVAIATVAVVIWLLFPAQRYVPEAPPDTVTAQEQVNVQSAHGNSRSKEKWGTPIVKVQASKDIPTPPILSETTNVGSKNLSEQRLIPIAAAETNNGGTGNVQILCRPWAQVTIDGVSMGTTPIRKKVLPTGKHRVYLRNDELNFEKKIQVHVKKGKTIHINESIDLAKAGDG